VLELRVVDLRRDALGDPFDALGRIRLPRSRPPPSWKMYARLAAGGAAEALEQPRGGVLRKEKGG
jgi:hypothetical protein